MALVTVRNAGPLIAESNYWGSEFDQAGGFFLSPNAGALRVLVPSGWESEHLRDTHGAREVIVSRGHYPPARGGGIELLWEDGTDSPYSLHVSAACCVPLIAASDHGRTLDVTIWTRRRGKPHLARTFPGRFRVVASLPWLRPWEESQ